MILKQLITKLKNGEITQAEFVELGLAWEVIEAPSSVRVSKISSKQVETLSKHGSVIFIKGGGQ